MDKEHGFTEIQKQIEKKEFDFMRKLNLIITDNLNLFNTNLENSMEFISYITLPIIMASIENRSFNPFSEIIEKHISFILNSKMASLGYNFLPLGYSSDLSYENEDTVIHIDIKTANLENPSDFKDTVALGINQTSYPGKLNCRVIDCSNLKVYPNIPSYYNDKLTITNALLFIYPDYKDIIDKIRDDYTHIREIISGDLKNLFKANRPISAIEMETIEKFLDQKVNAKTKKEVILDNLIRGYFVNNHEEYFKERTKRKLETFSKKVYRIGEELKEREIKPIAILSISIPNGALSPHYDEEFVSGKSWGSSFRYHYKRGNGNATFKSLPENRSRVIFLYHDPNYLEDLREYFNPIVVYTLEEKKI